MSVLSSNLSRHTPTILDQIDIVLDLFNEGNYCGDEEGYDFLCGEFHTLCVELCDPMGSDYVSPSVNIATDAHDQSEV